MNASESDGNRRHEIVGPAQSEVAIELIARVFSQDEPLAVTVGQSRDEFTRMLGVFLPAALPARQTMAALIDGKLVGIALTTAFTFTPPPEIEGTSPNYPPIGALIAALERDYEILNAERLDRCAHLHMLAVDAEVRGQGVAQALVEATARNAASNGFDALLTDATNPTSQSVFAKLGFETLNEMAYESFAHDGAPRFASLAKLGSIKLMEKRL